MYEQLGYRNATMLGVISEICLAAIITDFLYSLGSRPKGSRFIFSLDISLFAVIMGLMLYLVGAYVNLLVQLLWLLRRVAGTTEEARTLCDIVVLLLSICKICVDS